MLTRFAAARNTGRAGMIPVVSDIRSTVTTSVVFSVWFVGSSDKCQEFQELEVPAIVESSDAS